MRPAPLFPYFADISTLPGIGPKFSTILQKLTGNTIKDILFHLPINILERKYQPSISGLNTGDIATLTVEVQQHEAPPRNRPSLPYKVRCYNPTGFVTLVFFNVKGDYVKRQLPEGEKRVISGKVSHFEGAVQMPHPEYIVPEAKSTTIKAIEPVYPLKEGLPRKVFNKVIDSALDKTGPLPEWLEESLIKQHNWPDFYTALTHLHKPTTLDGISAHAPHVMRLAYDELLAHQLSLKLFYLHNQIRNGQPLTASGTLEQQVRKALPFTLTSGQEQVISEIKQDLTSDKKMLRLLQGDVGSGKTVVSLLAMTYAVEAGFQAALMAPTEILARQHYSWISEILASTDVKIGFLSGKTSRKDRNEILEKLSLGEIDILIGTHALFQKDVTFKSLALAVIDEQHRFGVEQRAEFTKKGKGTNLLLMSATPIPRTLTLSLYGDMDSSQLTEKPSGRKPVTTKAIPASREKEIINGLHRVLEKGEKIYWICPLIEQSEAIDLACAEDRYNQLKKIFGQNATALVHGKMPQEKREEVMLDFKHGKTNILVATTVIEVGVDVKDATVIVIEQAERFGLAQLHQLRGRVGRSDKQSSCILLYKHLSDTGKQRLNVMRDSNDGFYIAEEDLKLRGGGDILGTKQSGLPEFRIANLFSHFDLLKHASSEAKYILNTDGYLKSERGRHLKILLELFDHSTHFAQK